MAQNAQPTVNNPYAQRILRRMVPVILTVIGGFTLAAIFNIVTTQQQRVTSEHINGLSRVTTALEAELERYAENILALRQATVTAFNPVEQATDFEHTAEDLVILAPDVYQQANLIPVGGATAEGEIEWLRIENVNGRPRVVQASGNPYAGQQMSAYETVINASEDRVVFGGFRTLQEAGGQARPMLDVYVPVFENERVTRTIHLVIDATRLLNIVNLSQDGLIEAAPNRRVILLDAASDFITEGITAGTSAWSNLREDPTGEKRDYAAWLRDVTDEQGSAEYALLHQWGAGRVLTSDTIRLDGVSGANWQVVVVDEVGAVYASSIGGGLLRLAVGVALALLVIYLARRWVLQMLTPVAEAEELLYHINAPTTLPFQPTQRSHHLVEAVQEIGRQLNELHEEVQQQTQRRRRDLEVAGRIGREAAAQRNLDELMKHAINAICTELGVYHAQVFLLDETNTVAELRYSRGEAGRKLLERGHRLAVGSETIIGTVTEEQRPVFVNDTIVQKDDPHGFNPLLPQTRAELGLPLMVGDRLLGALDIQSREPGIFKSEDLPTYELLADQLAVAINNAQLRQIAARFEQEASEADRQKTQRAWADMEESVRLREHYGAEVDKAGIQADIRVRGQVIGQLQAALPEELGFTEGDQILLESVAERVALAMENARLFQETQIGLAEVYTLYQLSRQLNDTNALHDVLQAVIRNVAVEAASGQLWLFDELDSDIAIAQVDLEIIPGQKRRDMTGSRLNMTEHPFLQHLTPLEVVFVEDTRAYAQGDAALAAIFERLGGQALAFIPLSVRGTWNGFLSIQFLEPRRFSEKEVRLYNALMAQAGVTVDNRLLSEQTQQSLERQERLYSASRIINTMQRLPDLIYAAVATARIPELDFWLSLLAETRNPLEWPRQARLVARSHQGSIIEEDLSYRLHVAEASPLRSREPDEFQQPGSSLDNVLAPPGWIRDYGYQSLVVFPLYSENVPIGLFYIASPLPYTLTMDDYDVYKALTGQMSTQIQKQNLLASKEEALNEARRLYVATRAISGASDMPTIFDTVASYLAMPFIQSQESDDFNFELSVSILLAQPEPTIDAPLLKYAYQWNSDPTIPLSVPVGTVLEQRDVPFGALISDNDDSMLIYHDVDEDGPHDYPAMIEALQQGGLNCAAAAPLWAKQRWFGVLIIRTDRPDLLDQNYERFMQAIADQIAIAIENQELLRETEYQRARLDTVLSTLPSGVLVLDPVTLKPERHNPRAEELLGQPIDYETGFSVERYNMYRTGTNMRYPVEELPVNVAKAEDRQDMVDDIAIRAADNETIIMDLMLSAAPIYDQDGRKRAIVAAMQDISQLRGMENNLQENLRETVFLYETQSNMADVVDEEELFALLFEQFIVQQPSDLYIFRPDDEGQELHQLRYANEALAPAEALWSILREDVLNIGNIQEAPQLDDAAREALGARGFQSVLVLPMLATMRPLPLAWLVLCHEEAFAFTLEDERLMTAAISMASSRLNSFYLQASTEAALESTAMLYNATKSLSRSRDREELVAMLKQALRGMGADMMAGYLINEDDTEELFKEGFDESEANGLDMRYLNQVPLPRPDGMYVANWSRSPLSEFERTLLQSGNIQAFAAINLRIKDSPGGRLYVGYTQPHKFVEADERYLSSVADSASVVLDNQSLLTQVQSTLQETSVLYQASQALTAIQEPEEIIDVIANYLVDTHINQVFVAILSTERWDDPLAAVDVIASWQSGSNVNLTGVTLTPEEFPAWAQLSTPSVLIINDIYDETYELGVLEQTSIASLDTRSLVVIPLAVSDRNIGVIWLGSREPHRYTDRDLRIYQAFAEQSSRTLDSIYLLDQSESRARQLETTAVVSQSVGQIVDLDILLPEVVELIKAQFSYDHVQIFLMDEQKEWALLRASTGEPGRKLLEIEHKLRRGTASVIGQMAATASMTVALDTSEANVVHQPNPYLPLTRSELAIPLRIKGELIGALDVQSNEPNAFHDEDVKALTALAAQISVAIDNVRLYEDAQRRAKEMGFLFEVTSKAAAAPTLPDALQQVAEDLRNLVNSHSVVIYLPQSYESFRGARRVMMEANALASVDAGLRVSSVEVGDPSNLIGVVSSRVQTEIIENVEDELRYDPLSDFARSATLMPISSGTELVGLLHLENIHENLFDPQTIQLLNALVNSLAPIIQNTLLVEQLVEKTERLEEVDRLKSEFLASMSHELRTPLNSIIGFSRVMLKGIDGPLTEMQEQDLNTIYNSGNHLLNLINDILDQAKIEANRVNLKPTYFNIKPMIESVRSIAIGVMKEKALKLEIDIAPNLPNAYGDEFRSRQILLNLVTNAIKFTPAGTVTIRAFLAETEDNVQMIRLDVQDTGIGIAEENIPTIFEQFRQVDSSLTREVGGTGLGLPISKALAEMQGGELTVDSEVGVGSTFSYTIPLQPGYEKALSASQPSDPLSASSEASRTPSGLIRKADVERAKQIAQQAREQQTEGDDEDEEKSLEDTAVPKRPATKPTRSSNIHTTQSIPVVTSKRQVLIIEEDKDMVDQYRQMLQREGYEIQAVDHAAYAQAMVGQLRPTVVLLDVNFGDGQGWQLLQGLKERDDSFDIPVVIVTMDGDSERAYRLGAHAFLQRPFAPQQLIEAVYDAQQESERERILIIDDEPEAIRLLTELLAEHGEFRVFSASSGEEGISLVARRRPDLIILDLRMPEKDGFAVLDELRGNPETQNIPVLVVTGDIDLDSSELRQLENIHVLPKTDIGQQEYSRFIENVRSYLERNNGT